MGFVQPSASYGTAVLANQRREYDRISESDDKTTKSLTCGPSSTFHFRPLYRTPNSMHKSALTVVQVRNESDANTGGGMPDDLSKKDNARLARRLHKKISELAKCLKVKLRSSTILQKCSFHSEAAHSCSTPLGVQDLTEKTLTSIITRTGRREFHNGWLRQAFTETSVWLGGNKGPRVRTASLKYSNFAYQASECTIRTIYSTC